jgi:hypothetical protein
VADFVAVAHCFKSFDDAVRPQHIFWDEAEPLIHAALQCDAGMELDKIDTVSFQSRQSGFHRANCRGFDIADGVGLKADFRRDNRIRSELV